MLDLKNLKIFKKNGTVISQDNQTQDIFFNKKKEAEFKNDILKKAMICIFLTNILTYISLKEEKKTITQKRINTQGMVSLNLAIESYIPNDYEGEVKLIGPSNELITTNAKIEEKTQLRADFEMRELPIYVVSVKNVDGHKLVKYREKIIRAYPQSININNSYTNGGPHEISF